VPANSSQLIAPRFSLPEDWLTNLLPSFYPYFFPGMEVGGSLPNQFPTVTFLAHFMEI
jgi:hypothetical protein